ncbi:MAG: excalibur calcium-binding domain-containing protein [Proteobacteria bacterium]|nr:excalibur calcium-binding domain-containing protein [Pseudomonadota bacterium]MBS0494112.1 excalibur calcium-binding domain-containing protein [Pseudomonadota bacterium]
MFRILIIAVLAFGAWKGFEKYQARSAATAVHERSSGISIPNRTAKTERPSAVVPKFQCDGRTYCSQMTSCEEATFFLKNCPGVKMDGNNDGVPCEQQWCR